MQYRREPMPMRSQRGRAGFTLIELLIVIGIISGLMVWIVPTLLGASQETAKIKETQVLLHELASRAESYANQRRFGDYPPDNFRDPARKLLVVADSINPGIESLVAFLSREDSKDEDLSRLQEKFSNTDNDKSDAPIGRLDRPDKLEIVDAWGNPIVYFTRRSYRQEPQTYRNQYGEDFSVSAWKRKDGSFFNNRHFQLFSAGPDEKYGTPDDIGHNFVPEEQGD